MYTIFSRQLAYLAILLKVSVVFLSVSGSDVANNYGDLNNGRNYLCNNNNCGPTSTPPVIGRSPVYTRSEYVINNNNSTLKIPQWTFLNEKSYVRQKIAPPQPKGVNENVRKYDLEIVEGVGSEIVTQNVPQHEQQQTYSTIPEYVYPIETDTLHSETTTGDDHQISNIEHFQAGAEVNIYPEHYKAVVIGVSVFYLFLVILVNGNFLNVEQYASICDGPPAENAPLWHVRSENPRFHIGAHADSEMQDRLLNMFHAYGSHSDEDNSIEMPDLSHISSMCSKNAFFYGMNHQHMMAVEMVKDIFMNERGPHEMMSMARALRRSPDINAKVWYTALMKATHERPDMAGMKMPGPLDAMPDTFIPGHDLGRTLQARSGKARSHKGSKKCIRVDSSVGADNGPENLLWYFREDVMVNSHHWYWHLSYPLINAIQRDRRGEIFYYSHRSMTIRYNIERLCNRMPFVLPLEVYQGSPIPEGYNSHLNDFNSGKSWTDRPDYTPLRDTFHQNDPSSMVTILISNWLRSRDRLISSIKKGYFTTERGKMRIPNYQGIDILGNTLEAVDLSINPRYYDADGYHNSGHRIIGFAVDPDYRFQLPPGPMGDPATAMRDPVFYRWHTNVNNIFEKYKRTLAPYSPVKGEFPLLWKGVEIKEVSVISHKGVVNDLKTFWSKRKFDLSLGLAFNRTDDDDDDWEDKDNYLKVCATHLNHEEFEYSITVDRKPCAKSFSDTATVRIFIAPKYDLHGHRFTVSQQRNLFVHLDLFTVDLKVGINVIKRSSLDSTLTIPWTQSLRQLQNHEQSPNTPQCGCGWPHHLLLPKGTPEGMSFDIFVMLTNGDDDVVEDEHHGKPGGGQCGTAFLYCGIPNRLFPDRKPMGYPFDREIYKMSSHCSKTGTSIWTKICLLFALDKRPPTYLEEFTWGIPNMAFSEVLITNLPH